MIKTDLRRVLDRMQVQYRETRSGFECIHTPSIDLSTVQPDAVNNNRRSQQESSGGGVRRSLTKKASKLSFALKGKDKDGSPPKSAHGETSTLSSATAVRSDSTSSSLYNVSSNAHTVKPEEINGVVAEDASKAPSNDAASNLPLDSSPTKGKNLPPIPRDYAPQPQMPPAGAPLTNLPTGEVDPDVFDTIGSSTLCVRFEINIIKVRCCYSDSNLYDRTLIPVSVLKVPWLPLHGIQFRRVGGNGWQYQMLARRVLTELKL